MSVLTEPGRQIVGRYSLEREIGSGGMASVFLGRLQGDAGFTRLVAIKRLHPQYAKHRDFSAAFANEARLAARVSHANVVQVLDVVEQRGQLMVVMEYIGGETLAHLLENAKESLPLPIACKIVVDVLTGLHAAHEARDDQGKLLEIVHRDVSPQNVMVGADGTSRLIDFGIAKAVGLMQQTRDGKLKGKLGYLAPEAVQGQAVDRRVDIYAAGVMLWEMLAGRGLFRGDNELQVLHAILNADIPRPSTLAPGVGAELDRVVLRALSRDPELRFPTAEAMAEALEQAVSPAPVRAVAAWISQVGAQTLSEREQLVEQMLRTAPIDCEAITLYEHDTITRVILPQTTKEGRAEPPTLISAGQSIDAAALTLPETPAARHSMPNATLVDTPPTTRGETPLARGWNGTSGTTIDAPVLMAPTPSVRRPRRLGWVIAGSMVVLLGAALIWRFGVAPADTPEVIAIEPAADSIPPTPVVSSPPTPEIAPSAPSLPSSAHGTQQVLPPEPKRLPVVSRPPPKTKPTPDCNPPYVTDARGVKRFKAECAPSPSR